MAVYVILEEELRNSRSKPSITMCNSILGSERGGTRQTR